MLCKELDLSTELWGGVLVFEESEKETGGVRSPGESSWIREVLGLFYLL